MGGGDDFNEAYSDYMTEQANMQTTSEMMESMHETNMEVIDNIDGSDDWGALLHHDSRDECHPILMDAHLTEKSET